ncbi:MAG: YraN family protein [Candidatus Liptonbacteria bacterium]|nr:YraN family protein [Candidatus Liptonbacteria bacterium]
MTNQTQIGKEGEDIACKYLIQNKYEILGRNYRKPWGEIDIIARAPDRTLVFVEVKTLGEGSGPYDLTPEDNLTRAKLKKLRRVCQGLALRGEIPVFETRGWQIDLVAITLDGSEKPAIRHYENI